MDIYLDQNHWILLARAYHGREDRVEAIAAAEVAAKAVLAGTARFPISGIHLIELTKIGDEGRRRRLIKAMLFFSKGWIVKPVAEVAALELAAWARGEAPRTEVPVMRGLLAAMAPYAAVARQLGVETGVIEETDQMGDSPAAWSTALSSPLLRASAGVIDRLAANHVNMVESVRQGWARLPPQSRLATYAEGVLEDVFAANQPLSPDLCEAESRLGALRQVELLDAIAEIPTVDAQARLGEAKVRDIGRRTQPNDLWDLAFLSVAVPYFPFVVTERFWAHLANSTGVSETYRCRVLPNLEALAEHL